METARKIRSLAAELGIAQVWAVANRVRCDEERALIAEQLKGWNLLGFLPYSEGVAAGGRSATGLNPDQVEEWEGFKEVLGRIIP
jgi:CO dehydrogenase nickel-insertion accessory protein CooC1